MVSVHPAQRRASPLGVVPVGLGDGRDVANLQGKCLLYFPFFIFFGNKLYSFVKGMVSYFFVLLSMLVAEREPTPCNRDAYSVGSPKWPFLGERLTETL